MRMQKRFSRFKGVAGTALGSDVVPGAPNYGVAAPTPADGAEADNILVHRFTDAQGWPVHRIGVGYNYKSVGTPVALLGSIYIYDSLTQRWYQLGPATSLVDGRISFFDAVSAPPRVKSVTPADLAEATPGNELAMLIVTDTNPASAPNGEHEFVLFSDLTTIGY